MLKNVNILTNRPIRTTKIPIRRSINNTLMNTSDILKCIQAGAVVYENVDPDTKIMLTKDNYDEDLSYLANANKSNTASPVEDKNNAVVEPETNKSSIEETAVPEEAVTEKVVEPEPVVTTEEAVAEVTDEVSSEPTTSEEKAEEDSNKEEEQSSTKRNRKNNRNNRTNK